MKKITFLLLATLFAFSAYSQILNQTATWPDTEGDWTITGSYETDPSAFEADPTNGDSNFAFDDDDAGAGPDDIAAESPVIDLTAAFNGGEQLITVSGNHVFNYISDDAFLGIQYWDADAASWVDWFEFDADTESPAPQNNFCSATPLAYTTAVLNIAGFSSTQLSGFRYRIYWDDDRNGGDGFEWGFCFDAPTITSSAPANPCNVVTNPTFDSITETTVTFSWTPAVGNPVSYDWEIVPDGNAQGVGTVDSGSVAHPGNSAGSNALSSGMAYDLYIVTDCDGDGSETLGPLSFFTIPSNDDACDAIMLTLGDPAATYSNGNASIQTGEPGGSCWFEQPGPAVANSVWFTFTVPGEANITVSTDLSTGSLPDSQLALYSGDCTNLAGLTQLACSDDQASPFNPAAELTVNGLAAGTYLIQVDGAFTDEGTFDIELTGDVLSTNSFENESDFTYFPNPVKDQLTLKGKNNISDVVFYNLVGQQVLRAQPNSIESVIDMTALNTGAYFVNVTINGATKAIKILKQ